MSLISHEAFTDLPALHATLKRAAARRLRRGSLGLPIARKHKTLHQARNLAHRRGVIPSVEQISNRVFEDTAIPKLFAVPLLQSKALDGRSPEADGRSNGFDQIGYTVAQSRDDLGGGLPDAVVRVASVSVLPSKSWM